MTDADLRDDPVLLGLIDDLRHWPPPTETEWAELAKRQKAVILELWDSAQLVERMHLSVHGYGHTDPTFGVDQASGLLRAYADSRGWTLDEFCERLMPVPDLGARSLQGYLYQGVPITERHGWAWHHAERVAALAAADSWVAEIGAGLGYTALYARRRGLLNWVSLDLLPATVHQYLMYRAQDVPVTVNQPAVPGAVNLYEICRIQEAWWPSPLRYWVNTDSFAELPKTAVLYYLATAVRHGAEWLYSQNRERTGFAGAHELQDTLREAGWTLAESRPFPRSPISGAYTDQLWRSPLVGPV